MVSQVVKMKYSIKDIAAHLNLSRNTVSKALNGKPGVSESTRRKILETANELQYRQFLASIGDEQRSNHQWSILFLTKSHSHSGFWLSVMEGIKTALDKSGYTLVMSILSEQELAECKLPPIITSQDIKGIIIVEICNIDMCEKIIAQGLPVVTVDMPQTADGLLKKMDVVTMENKSNVKKIIRALAKKGFTRFSFAGDLFSDNVGDGFKRRYEAFLEALGELGLEEERDKSFTHETEENFLSHSYLVKKIKTFERLPEIYICGNDSTATQLANALNFCGYSIPEDVGIVGFDDIPESSDCLPPLTTIHTPKELMGRAAAFCVLDKIEHPEREPIFIQVPTKLIVRDSTAF
jgi:LacI family transcriptional regulator